MVAPVIYRSDDASAPVLNGTAGSLINVLDACLVNGYGDKPAAGWTKEFSGTNLAVYRMGTGGTARRMRLRVDDTNTTRSLMRGFDDMTDVNTGTEPFPTAAQLADGVTTYKSVTTGTPDRPWMIVATPTCFYLSTQPDQTVLGVNQGTALGQVFFGEYINNGPVGFVHHVALIGGASNSSTASQALGTITAGNAITALHGNFICRGHTDVAGSVQCSKACDWGVVSNGTAPGVMGLSTGLSVPDGASGKAFGARVRLLSPSWSVIGRLPGLWAPISGGTAIGTWLDTIGGSGPLSGRTLMVLHAAGSATTGGTNTIGRLLLDITDLD